MANKFISQFSIPENLRLVLDGGVANKALDARINSVIALREKHGGLWRQKNIFLPSWIARFLAFNREKPFNENLKAIRLNLGFLSRFLKARPLELGKGFELAPAVLLHPESPVFLAVNKAGQRIASIGGSLLRENGRLVLRINNVQGVWGQRPALEELTNLAGVNWRVFLANKVLDYARQKGLKVTGVKPERFSVMMAGEHKRLLRQYTQTYRKAGLQENSGVFVKDFPAKKRLLRK
ncbi:hypothetical protein HZB89_01525 [archaeon]|nr:hypothetical protein [archaeon]